MPELGKGQLRGRFHSLGSRVWESHIWRAGMSGKVAWFGGLGVQHTGEGHWELSVKALGVVRVGIGGGSGHEVGRESW